MTEKITMTETELTEIFGFLDVLRDSGKTNMFGARIYVDDMFGLGKAESGKALSLWMKTFKDGTATARERATNALA